MKKVLLTIFLVYVFAALTIALSLKPTTKESKEAAKSYINKLAEKTLGSEQNLLNEKDPLPKDLESELKNLSTTDLSNLLVSDHTAMLDQILDGDNSNNTLKTNLDATYNSKELQSTIETLNEFYNTVPIDLPFCQETKAMLESITLNN